MMKTQPHIHLSTKIMISFQIIKSFIYKLTLLRYEERTILANAGDIFLIGFIYIIFIPIFILLEFLFRACRYNW